MLIERLTVTHEDERRALVEWHSGVGMVQLKVVRAKAPRTQIGRHYHRNKTEVFFLLEGDGTVNGRPIHAGDRIVVQPWEVHAFDLAAGSLLLGGATAPFDPEDEVPA